MEKITNRQELKTLCEELQEQWFWFHSRYTFEEKKIDNIIWQENKLNIDYKRDELLKKYDWDFERFQEEMKNYFSQFNTNDKLKEVAKGIRPKTKEDGDRKQNTRTIVLNWKSLTLQARYNYYKIMELLRRLWYEMTISYRADWERLPEHWATGQTEKDWKIIRRECFKNGNIKFTGDIGELEKVYEEIRTDYNQDFIQGKEYSKEYVITRK